MKRLLGVTSVQLAIVAGCLVLLVTSTAWAAKTKIVFAESTAWPEWPQFIERFEEEYTDIDVEPVVLQHGTLAESLVKFAAGGQMPDVFTVLHDILPGLLSHSLVAPLEPFFARDNSVSIREYVPLDMGPKGLWALPLTINVWFTIYNRSLFAEAGVGFPNEGWSMDDLDSLATKLAVDTDGDGITDVWGFQGVNLMQSANQIDTFLWPFGASLFDSEGAPALNTPAARQSFEFWENLLARSTGRYAGYISSLDTVWMSGNVAMGFGDRVYLAPISQNFGYEWGLAPLPFQPGVKQQTVGTGHYFGISATTKHPEEAWTFLKWVTGPKGHSVFKVKAPLPGHMRAFPIYQQFWESRRGDWNLPHNIGLVTATTSYAAPPSIMRSGYTAEQIKPSLVSAINGIGNRTAPATTLISELQRQLEAMAPGH